MPTHKKAVPKGLEPRKTPERPLTTRQRRFVDEYLIHFNATKAAMRAGYSDDPNCAGVVGHENLRKIKIVKEINARLNPTFQRLKLSRERILNELSRIGFADVTNAVKIEHGAVKVQDTENMSLGTKRAIQSITETTTESGGSISVKFHDKVAALKTLAQYADLVEGDSDGDNDGASGDHWGPERGGLLQNLRGRRKQG